MKKKLVSIDKHILIPKHTKLSDKEKEKLLEKYHISINQMPKILKTDPALANLVVKPKDIIKIIRISPTAGEAIFYRVVSNV